MRKINNLKALSNPRWTNLSSLDCSISDLNMATKLPPSWFSLSRRSMSVSSSQLVSFISQFKDSTLFSSCGKFNNNATDKDDHFAQTVNFTPTLH